MEDWSFQFAQGWADRPFQDLKRVPHLDAEGGAIAVFCSHAFDGLGDTRGGEDRRFYPSDQGTDVMGRAFEMVASLPEYLTDDLATGVHLLFVNTDPLTSPLQPRPEPFRRDGLGHLAALELFIAAVAGSFAPRGMWSACEWAVLAAVRVADESDAS